MTNDETPKHEGDPDAGTQVPGIGTHAGRREIVFPTSGPSSFVLLSSFVIRHSSFREPISREGTCFLQQDGGNKALSFCSPEMSLRVAGWNRLPHSVPATTWEG